MKTETNTALCWPVIFLVMAVVIIAVGDVNYRHHAQRFRIEAENQISAIADLKVGELVQWRKERMGQMVVLIAVLLFGTGAAGVLVWRRQRVKCKRDTVSAGDELRASERLAQATLDALSAHIAVLDEAGVIIAVNRAWSAFAEANPPLASNVNEGANYLAVCDAVKGPDSEAAAVAAAGIRAVIRGVKDAFKMEYPCHSPDAKRWFTCRVSRVHGSGVARVTVAHENITTRKQAEEAQREQMDELQRWHQVTLGREGRVIELKREVNECLTRAGEQPRYASVNSEP